MSRLKLERFGSGDYLKYIYGDDTTRLVNIPIPFDDSVTDKFNLTLDGVSQLNNIYPISGFETSSSIATSAGDNLWSFQLPASGLIEAIMHNDFMVGITPMISSNPYTMWKYDHDLSAHVLGQNDDEHSIVIYPPSGNITHISAYSPIIILKSIDLNYAMESPISDSTKRVNFNEGYFLVNAFHLKNFYNPLYDVDTSWISSTISTSASISAASLNHTRDYVNLGSNGEDVWFAYVLDDKYYETISASLVLSGVTQNRTLSSFGLNATEYPLSSYDLPSASISAYTPNYLYRFEFIERVKGLNAFGVDRLHKSNLFSVEIKNSGLNEDIIDDAAKESIQLSINNILKKMINKFIPAHTQLFKIYWKGK